jgi:hypothetical protein
MYVFSAVFCPCQEMLGLKSKLLSSAITSPGFKELGAYGQDGGLTMDKRTSASPL